MSKKPKRPSVGERIAAKVDVEWGYSGEGAAQVREDDARRIDAEIRRAVREAWAHSDRHLACRIGGQRIEASNAKEAIEQKYGVTL